MSIRGYIWVYIYPYVPICTHIYPYIPIYTPIYPPKFDQLNVGLFSPLIDPKPPRGTQKLGYEGDTTPEPVLEGIL